MIPAEEPESILAICVIANIYKTCFALKLDDIALKVHIYVILQCNS